MKSYQTVAEAIRVEYNKETDETLLIFKIVDLDFKKRMLHNFSQDIELVIKDKNAII